MLDIKFVRENPEVVKQNIRNKFQDNKLELVDKVLELDKENRESKETGSCFRKPYRRTFCKRERSRRRTFKRHDGNSEYYRSICTDR